MPAPAGTRRAASRAGPTSRSVPRGRAQAAAWRLPPGFAGAACITSPLSRARQTAELLGFADPPAMPDWWRWPGAASRVARCQSCELSPPPPCASWRKLAWISGRPEARARGWWPIGSRPACRSSPVTGRDHVVITHKGVLRASLVLALGWDMLGKPPVRYEPEQALIHGRSRPASCGSRPRCRWPCSGERAWRCLFWVQSLLGSGHLRRALLLAEAFAARGGEVTLANGGSPGPWAPAPGVRLVQLPPISARNARFRRSGGRFGEPRHVSVADRAATDPH